MPDPLNGISNFMLQQAVAAGQHKEEPAADDPEGMKEVCKDFESLFVNYLMKEMRNTIPENELFGGGSAEKIYTTMLDGEVAKHVSKQRGIGLADMLCSQMARNSSIKK